MHLHVTFVYEASVIPSKKRNPETHRYLGTTTVEIPEMKAEDLPVAFRYRSNKRLDADRGHLHEIRWTPDMGHWEERTRFERVGRTDEHKVERFDAKWLEDRCDVTQPRNWKYGRNEPFGLFPGNDYGSTDGMVRVEDDPNLRRLVSSELAERAASIQEVAAGLLLVDGRLFEPAKEPAYEASTSSSIFDRDDRCFLDIVRVDPKPTGQGYYRADERDYMMQAREMRSGADSMIEVINPDAVRVPLPEIALLCAADDIFESMKGHLEDVSKDTFSAYADLRDAKAAFGARMASYDRNRESPPDASDLMVAIQAAMAVLPDCNEYCGDWVENRVNLARERYDARTLAADFSAPSL